MSPPGSLRAPGVASRTATAALLILVAAAPLLHAEPRVRVLTAAAQGDAGEIALAHARAGSRARGPEPAGVEWRIRDRYRSLRSGLTHLTLQRELAGIEIADGGQVFAVSREGRLIGSRSPLRPPAPLGPGASVPLLDAAQALGRCARELGLEPGRVRVTREGVGPERRRLLRAPSVADDPLPARLVYFPASDGALRLAWELSIQRRDLDFSGTMTVDARTGELLQRANWIVHASYTVFPQPLTGPDEGERAVRVDPFDPTASPLGWHDVGTGPTFSVTRGNNAVVQEDVNADDEGGFRPDGGAGLVFDFPLDLAQAPSTHQAAALSNVFYQVNLLHDVHYRYGFDEAAGNLQESNLGAGGLGNDAVFVDVQDGRDLNNASMETPPDGNLACAGDPRERTPCTPSMELHLFDLPTLLVESPARIANRYRVGGAVFGPPLASAEPVADLVLALDPSDPNGPSTTDACSPLTNPAEVLGRVALVDRGTCFFVQKVLNVQAAGGLAVVIADNVPGPVFTMHPPDPNGTSLSIDIPAVLSAKSHGELLKESLSEGVRVRFSGGLRDGGFDSTLIAHEYGHAVSNRLTGGPANAFCLGVEQSAGLGEGWSDFWALAFTARTRDAPSDPRYIAPYAAGLPGFRNFPYTTDLSLNPQTFRDILFTNRPHGVGEIWAAALWDLNWRLIAEHGFDPNLVAGGGGNGLLLQLVMDALKLQPCNPSFLEARDAILLSDQLANGAANRCAIWEAFARRGMGAGARSPAAPSLVVTEDFQVPPECRCSDADFDGTTGPEDVALIRSYIAFPEELSAVEIQACQGRSASGRCDIFEIAVLSRALSGLGLGPGLVESCQ